MCHVNYMQITKCTGMSKKFRTQGIHFSFQKSMQNHKMCELEVHYKSQNACTRKSCKITKMCGQDVHANFTICEPEVHAKHVACCFSSISLAMDPLIALVFFCSDSTSSMLPEIYFDYFIYKSPIFSIFQGRGHPSSFIPHKDSVYCVWPSARFQDSVLSMRMVPPKINFLLIDYIFGIGQLYSLMKKSAMLQS